MYSYFKQYENLGASSDVDFGFNIDEQRRVLGAISKQLFDKIWYFSPGIRRYNKECAVSIRSLSTIPNGLFADYLIDVTKDNQKLFETYHKPFSFYSHYTPEMNATLFFETSRFDLGNRDQLILVAIHLFTISYPTELR
jgi:hypothetical protein